MLKTCWARRTGVCSAWRPPRPFSKLTTVKDLSNHRLRPPPTPLSARSAASSFVAGDRSSSATQKRASSTAFSEAALTCESSRRARSDAHASRSSEVNSDSGGSSTCGRKPQRQPGYGRASGGSASGKGLHRRGCSGDRESAQAPLDAIGCIVTLS
eukprot:scaffold95_cov109-Isochrysis_galbana.AAC.3